MRRLLAAGFAAAVVATAAACGNGDDGGDGNGAETPAAGNTPEVCADAEQVQVEAQQQLQQDLAELQSEDLDQETFEEDAVEIAQGALVDWSEGLRDPAERAEDPELALALTDLADGLEDAAPQLTIESLQPGGEIPNAEQLDDAAMRLTELCPTPTPPAPATPPSPAPTS